MHTFKRLRCGRLSATCRLPWLRLQAFLVAREWARWVLPAEEPLLVLQSHHKMTF